MKHFFTSGLACMLAVSAVSAQNGNNQSPTGFDEEQRMQSIKEALGADFLMSPMENSEEDYLLTPFRPAEVTTFDMEKNNLYKYVYTYDREGKDLGGTGPCLVRSHYKWDGEKFIRDTRFKAFLDENTDMTRYFMDQGGSEGWENYYRFVATYDEEHNQLTGSQEYWKNGKWDAQLRWTTKYENGRKVEENYENRYTGDEWTPGLRIVWEYDENGNETNYEQQNRQGSEYVQAIGETKTYDERGNLLSRTTQAQGKNLARSSYTYNELDSCTSATEERWDNTNQVWNAMSYIKITYDDKNRRFEALKQVPETPLPLESVKWVDKEKVKIIYFGTNELSTNEITSVLSEDGLYWKESKRKILRKNEQGLRTTWSEDTCDLETGKWTTVNQELFTYDERNNLLTYKFQTNVGQDKGENGTPFSTVLAYDYTYDDNNNAISTSSSVKSEKDAINLYYNAGQHEWGCPEYDSWSANATYLDLNDYVTTASAEINAPAETVKAGETIRLQAAVMPENASNKEVLWESMNEDIAIVNVDGAVTGMKEGTATIKATTLDGLFEATCDIKVTGNSSVETIESDRRIIAENGLLTVSGTGIERITVYDVNGRIMAATTESSVSTADWNKGLYIVEVAGEGTTTIHKIVI